MPMSKQFLRQNDRNGGSLPDPGASTTKRDCYLAVIGHSQRPAALGRRCGLGVVTPGASRRAVSPTRCQGRCSVSQAYGSVNPPCNRMSSAIRDSWVVVGTYTVSTPPG